MASGYQNVLGWAAKRLLAESKRRIGALGAEACDNADKLYYKLKNAGAAVPKSSKWNSLSCDQKIAFITALGPLGASMLAAGVLLGGWASNAGNEMARYASTAAGKIGDAGADWVKSAGGSVGEFVDNVNPFNGVQGISLANGFGNAGRLLSPPTLRVSINDLVSTAVDPGMVPSWPETSAPSRPAWALPLAGLFIAAGAVYYFKFRRR